MTLEQDTTKARLNGTEQELMEALQAENAKLRGFVEDFQACTKDVETHYPTDRDPTVDEPMVSMTLSMWRALQDDAKEILK